MSGSVAVKVARKDIIDRRYGHREIDILGDDGTWLSEPVHDRQIARHRVKRRDCSVSKICHPKARLTRNPDHNDFGHIPP
ncbi:hypothetical protein SAMCFNEI73_Ch2558 [Sinorhizobium americanum]|uniref:Uncharacterized protein n=1 Tax=Sinorhizobium americanum TaxID=194963 RepID=A0A1L3LP58_9HYPH|nr:hypothetical protein SAMCFNEI73_Ch2558 [Sinorhizobium americanum]